MGEDDAKPVFEGVPLNRRAFVKRLIAGAFAVPAIVSFSEAGVTEASAHPSPHGHHPHPPHGPHPSPTTTLAATTVAPGTTLPATTLAPTTTLFTTTPAPTTTLFTTTPAPTTTLLPMTTTPAPTTTLAG